MTRYDITNYEATLELVKAVGEYKGNIIKKNEKRFQYIDMKANAFKITLPEWQK